MHKHSTVRVSMQAPLAEVLTRCRELHVEDKKAERAKWNWRTGAVFAFVFGVTFLFAGFDVPALFIAAILLIIVGFRLLKTASKVELRDIDDRKLEVAQHVLHVLEPEISPKKPLALDLDFSAYNRTTPISSEGGGYGPRTRTYKHNWLNLQVPLANGARVALAVSIHAKRKEKPKNSYTKVKERSNETLRVVVVPPRGAVLDEGLQQRLKAGAPPGLQLMRSRVKPRAVEFVFATETVVRQTGVPVSGAQSLLTGPAIIGAVIVSYKSTEHGLQGRSA